MNVSRRWLEAFLRRELDRADLTSRLAQIGAPADAVEPLHAELGDIVVGQVEDVRPHPNADRLRLCLVNDGSSERRKVVCGAANVTAGTKYPFAPVGARLPGGLVIERRKIRGEPSEGMLCSARELGLGEDRDGILALETDAEPGASFIASLGLADDRLVLDTSPMRPDLLGHKGLARELAAAYRTTFRLPEIPGADAIDVPQARRVNAASGTTDGVEIAIEKGSSCARFTAAVIRGVRIGPSPAWLARRLEAVGIRSINNVVDATNYVMFEVGQPLHAYDLARIAGGRLAARSAHRGEQLLTLDGMTRQLSDTMTVIADGERAVGVAGVMGGRDSEVTESTTDILLECAWFEPRATRRARRALGIATEASQRFERGTDLWGVPDALRRAVTLILTVAGGSLSGDPVDVWPEPRNPPRVFLRTRRVGQILGVELPVHEMERALLAIGATVLAKPAEERLAVEVPGWRPDLVAEIDLIEEIARQYGYDRFPDDLLPSRAGNQVDAAIELAARSIREGLAAEGLYEAVTLPMGGEVPGTVDAVRVLNPLSQDHSHLRRWILPGLIRQVEANWANHVRDVRLFEIGTAFESKGSGSRPHEETHVGGVVTGGRWPAHWSDGGHTPDVDRWDLKALFERAISLAIPGAVVQVQGAGWVARLPDGRQAGRAEGLTADAPPWAADLWGFEVLVDPAARGTPRFTPVPATPAASRDLALLLPEGLAISDVLDVLSEAGGSLLEEVSVIDEFRGEGIPPGRRSVAVRLVLRGRDRTLRDTEVDSVIDRMLQRLETIDVGLRTT
ncbi:MAG: phenylalanine--tRNA ligase subunit beta [Gemmatimonadales bacterium]